MRLPRSRFTVRRMMAAILLMAVLISVGQTCWRWRSYRNRAEYYTAYAQMLRESIDLTERERARERRERPKFRRLAEQSDSLSINDREVSLAEFLAHEEQQIASQEASDAGNRAVLAYIEELQRKYERAARTPWRGTGPDPPPPWEDIADNASPLVPLSPGP